MRNIVRLVKLVLVLAAANGVVMGASAQNYPVKPIRWVLGFPAGGASDILARTIAARLTEVLGQQVIVDNRPGASGIIANDIVAKSPSDGYTMLLVSATYANLISMGKKVPYDPQRDLAPVILITSVQNILATHPSLPAKSVKELIAIAKKKAGEINYGSGGPGTAAHLGMELFRLTTGINLVHIPYKGSPPAMNDLIAGRVEVMLALSPLAMPYVRSGKLRALAVSGKRRMPELPAVPTIAETVPGFEVIGWQGVMMPGNTPELIVARLNTEIGKILTAPEVAARLAKLEFQVEGGTPSNFAGFLEAEVIKWRKVIHEAKISFD